MIIIMIKYLHKNIIIIFFNTIKKKKKKNFKKKKKKEFTYLIFSPLKYQCV